MRANYIPFLERKLPRCINSLKDLLTKELLNRFLFDLRITILGLLAEELFQAACVYLAKVVFTASVLMPAVWKPRDAGSRGCVGKAPVGVLRGDGSVPVSACWTRLHLDWGGVFTGVHIFPNAWSGSTTLALLLISVVGAHAPETASA